MLIELTDDKVHTHQRSSAAWDVTLLHYVLLYISCCRSCRDDRQV